MTNLKKLILLGGDLIILYVALAIALFIRYGTLFTGNLKDHLGPFSMIFTIWLMMFYLSDLYRYKIFRDSLPLFKKLLLTVSISAAISIIAFYLFNAYFELTPKTNLIIFSIVFLLLDFLWRQAMIKAFTSGAINIILFGESPLITETISYLEKSPQMGYKTVEWFKDIKDVNYEKIKEIILKKHVSIVVVPNHITKDFSSLRMIYKLLALEVNVINFWDFYEIIFEKVPLDELQEGWFIENIAARKKFYDATKRIIDFMLASFFCVVFSPFIILISILIKLTSPGPIIYKQKRIGKNGSIFTLYKFRTMYHNNEGPLWTTENDNRITKIGKILRFTHLDELPQVINIFKNYISFIGPRPEREELVEKYKNFPYYEIRHLIKPGLTGWAQINYKPSASLEEAKEKLCYDIFYIKNRSLFLDMVIILKTIKYVFISSHAS